LAAADGYVKVNAKLKLFFSLAFGLFVVGLPNPNTNLTCYIVGFALSIKLQGIGKKI